MDPRLRSELSGQTADHSSGHSASCERPSPSDGMNYLIQAVTISFTEVRAVFGNRIPDRVVNLRKDTRTEDAIITAFVKPFAGTLVAVSGGNYYLGLGKDSVEGAVLPDVSVALVDETPSRWTGGTGFGMNFVYRSGSAMGDTAIIHQSFRPFPNPRRNVPLRIRPLTDRECHTVKRALESERADMYGSPVLKRCMAYLRARYTDEEKRVAELVAFLLGYSEGSPPTSDE